MPKFQIQIEEKITIWERRFLDIEAENLEEAKKIAKQNYEDFEYDPELDWETDILFDTRETLIPEDNGGCPTLDELDWETDILFDTRETLIPEDNGGCPTLEVYVKHDKGRDLVYQNAGY